MAFTLKQLRELSLEKLIEEHDNIAKSTVLVFNLTNKKYIAVMKTNNQNRYCVIHFGSP